MKTKPKSKSLRVRPTSPILPPPFVRFLPEEVSWIPMSGRGVNLLTDLQESVDSCDEGDRIRFHCDRFAQERNPLDLLSAVVLSVNLGVYPPVPLLHAVSTAFQAVLESEGKMTLDTALKLKGSKTGVLMAITQRKKMDEHYFLAYTLYCLRTAGPMSIASAAERLSFAFESQVGQTPYSAEALMQHYSRTWKKQFHFEKTIDPHSPAHPHNWPPARRTGFLAHYPLPSDSL